MFLPFQKGWSRGVAVAIALAASFAAAGCEDVPNMIDPQDKKEDVETKKEHFEEAAQTYYEGGRYLQSVMQWRKVLEIEPTRQKARWGLAKSLTLVGTPEALREAESIFKEIVDLDWSHPTLGDRKHEILRDFGDVYSQLADFYDQDARILEKKLEQPDADTAMLRQRVQTQTSIRNELLRKVVPFYEQALSRSPDNNYAIGGLAKAYLMIGGADNDRRGIEYARRYVAISQRSQAAWEEKLGAVEKELGAVNDDQRKYYKDRARGARDKELKLHLLLGPVLVRSGDFAAAITEYDRVIELDPTLPAAYVERAQAEAMSGDYARAITDIEHYLKITDPVSQREARINAAELLQKYRLIRAGRSSPAPAAR